MCICSIFCDIELEYWLFHSIALKSATGAYCGPEVKEINGCDWLNCSILQGPMRAFPSELIITLLYQGKLQHAHMEWAETWNAMQVYIIPIDKSGEKLTHWSRDKMAAILQTTHSNAFSWMKMLQFCLRFYWNLFLRVQLTIFEHWFR